MTSVFTAFDWLEVIFLGGVVGALGQVVRMVVGFKKLHDATSGVIGIGDMVATHRLLVPLGIGFVAGALAAASTITDLGHISGQQILAIAAAGYAGADFIEGFMSRVAPAADVPLGQEGVGVAPIAPAPPPPPVPAPAPPPAPAPAPSVPAEPEAVG